MLAARRIARLHGATVMKLLAVETATGNLSVAVLDQDTVLAQVDEEATGAHTRLLIPAIDRVLAACGLALADLDGLAVSIGPGSFTGLRVGLATMVGFRAVTGLPLAAVPTLEGLAWNLRGAPEVLCPLVTARAGEVYWARYRWTNDETLHALSDEQVGPVEQVVARMDDASTVFLGDGCEAHRASLRAQVEAAGGRWVDAPAGAASTSAVSIGLAAWRRLARGETAPVGIAPRYVQRAEAEVKWEQRRGAGPRAGVRA